MQLRVFLVEDLQNMRTLLEDLFGTLGDARIVGTASTEAEANLWLAERPDDWDLVIIDLVLAEGSGMNVIQRAKETHPAGRIAVFSSYASPGVRDHCLRLGADVVFPKADTADFIAWLHQQAGVDAGKP